MSRLLHRASRRRRQLASLATYLPRVGRWSMVPSAALLAAGLITIAATTGAWGDGAAVTTLRLAAVMLASALVFALDDPAAVTLAASPTALRWRRGTSVLVALASIGLLWTGLVALTVALLQGPADAGRPALPVRSLTVELGMLGAVGVVVAALVARRLGGNAGGIAAGPAVVLAFLAATGPLDLLPASPLDPAWETAHERLLLVTVVASAVAAWATRDPWQRRGAAGPG